MKMAMGCIKLRHKTIKSSIFPKMSGVTLSAHGAPAIPGVVLLLWRCCCCCCGYSGGSPIIIIIGLPPFGFWETFTKFSESMILYGEKFFFIFFFRKFEGRGKISSFRGQKDTSIAGLRTPEHPVLFSRDPAK